MKAKKLMTGLLLMMFSMPMMAQTTLKAVLVDSLTQEGEPYATVRIFKSRNMKEPVAMAVSDMDGNVSQTVNGRGQFVVTFNSVGRKEIRRTFTSDGKADIDLGTLRFQDDSQLMEGVTVVAQKPLVKMETDKMSYNVQDDVDSKTATVLDMLRKVPMVTVDGQDNITVNGSSSFRVYVNGKPSMMFNSSPAQVMKSMPASMVSNIEVITNPGARYDAEGAGGVLNLVMAGQGSQQATISGVNGNVRVSAGNRMKNAGVFLNGQFGRFSFSANAMANYGKNKGSEMEMLREQYSDLGTSVMDYKMKSTTRMPFQMGNLNMSYELDSLSTMGLALGLRSFGMKNEGNPTTSMHGGFYGEGFSYGQWTKSENRHTSFDVTLDYQRFLNTSRTSSISLIYQFGFNPTKNDSWSTYDINESMETGAGNEEQANAISFEDRYSHSKEKAIEHTVQADYTTPLGSENHKLNTGVKFTARDNSSDARYYLGNQTTGYQYNEPMSMLYSHTDDILAGYAEYEGKFGKVGTKAGLRYEHTWQNVEYELGNGENFKKNYGNLVPTASLSYQLSQAMNIGLTYNLRISRPGISYLNPYVDRSSNTALTYGNPDLDVEESHNIGLVFNLYTPKFMANLNIRQSITDNGISQYSFYEDELLHTTYGNVVRSRNTNASLWANWMLAPKTRLFMNGGISYVDLRSRALDAHNAGWQANMMFGIQQTLPWDLKLGVFTIASTKNYSLQGWNSGFNMISANINKSFFHDKLTIGLQGMSGLRKGGKLHFDSFSSGKDFISRTSVHVPMSNVSLSITWNFGNSKVQTKQNTNRVDSDVLERTSDMEQMNNQMGGGSGSGMPM